MKIREAIENYCDYLTVNDYSLKTVKNEYSSCKKFADFLETRKVYETYNIEYQDISNFFSYLEKHEYQKNGITYKISKNTVNRYASSVKQFLIFLYWNELTFKDLPKKIPPQYKITRNTKDILTEKEIKKMLDYFDKKDCYESKRNKAIIEVLYNTGIRFGELGRIRIKDVYLNSDLINIIQSKSRNERYAPMTKKLKKVLDDYINNVRPYLLYSYENEYLFFSPKGKMLHSAFMTRLFSDIKKEIKLTKKLHTHIFRHTFAIHLLKNGCSMKYIKELLGHKVMSATLVYTEIMNKDLSDKLKKHHPFYQKDIFFSRLKG